ncbi:MAG TPA: MMPL family transporter [Solirubrobacteraceae bacterium]|nr:MMPL family transporter [Solirubrobacteraceae bacterium]
MHSQETRFSVDGAFEALARFVVRFRWLVVAFWLLVAIVTSAALPSLSSEVNDNNSAFLQASAPSTKAANLAAPLLGGGASGRVSEITIIASRSGGLTSADLSAIARETALAQKAPSVVSATELGISADGEAAQIRVRVDLSANDITKDKTIVDALEGTFSSAGAPAGLELHLAGQVATLVANQASSNKAGKEVQNFTFLFIIVLLLFVFRSIVAALVTLIPSGLALLISFRLIGELGAHGLLISSITQVLLIVLLLGAGTDYGLFLVFRVREELREGHEPHEAVRRGIVRVGESITASAGTVILALLTLLFASFGLYHDLGVPLAVGVAVMLLIGLTLLPALLAILGRKAFWPSKTAPGTQKESAWGRIAVRLVQHPKATLALGVVLFLGLAAGALGYHSAGFGGATNPPAGSDAAAGNAALAKHYPQSSSNPANLVFAYGQPAWTDPSVLAKAEGVLRASGEFTSLAGPLNPNGTTLSPAELARLYAQLGPPQRLPVSKPAGVSDPVSLYNAYRSTSQFISADGRIVQFEAALTAGAQDSTAAMSATPRVRAAVTRAADASGAVNSGVAGEAAAIYDISSTANHDLRTIIPIAVIAIAILLALVLRSLVAPLYLIVSVVFSYLAALGVATIVFIDLGGDSGISFFLPFLMFIFLLALGEDYNILVMTRIREEARKLPLREAVIRAIARTGPTVTSAGLILGGTFAVFALVGGGGSEGSQLRAIGFGLAAGILMDTFFVRTLLVPSTVILLGRWNWWPSKLSRATGEAHAGVHPRAAVDPSEAAS